MLLPFTFEKGVESPFSVGIWSSGTCTVQLLPSVDALVTGEVRIQTQTQTGSVNRAAAARPIPPPSDYELWAEASSDEELEPEINMRPCGSTGGGREDRCHERAARLLEAEYLQRQCEQIREARRACDKPEALLTADDVQTQHALQLQHRSFAQPQAASNRVPPSRDKKAPPNRQKCPSYLARKRV